MISKEVFFEYFKSLVPGEQGPASTGKAIKSDIYFEPISMFGLEEMHKYSIDERLYEYLEFAPFKTVDETKAYLQKLIDRTAEEGDQQTAMYWFVRRKSDKRLVGTAGLVNLNYGRQSIEWGYGVDPELWGFGYILQIQELLKHYVFSVLELNRLDGVTIVTNERTISSLLAAGMKQEGLLQQFFCKNGEYLDGWKYAMLRRDYIEQNSQEIRNDSRFTSEDVIDIISSILDEDINEDSTMFNTANWDSLNHMSIMVEIFERTKINLSPIQISNATSVTSITKLINGISRIK